MLISAFPASYVQCNHDQFGYLSTMWQSFQGRRVILEQVPCVSGTPCNLAATYLRIPIYTMSVRDTF